MSIEAPTRKHEKAGASIGRLVDEKNKAYGDSFAKAGDILKLLYPYGAFHDQFNDLLAITRIIDKLFRVATHRKGDPMGENPWMDIAGYAILRYQQQQKQNPVPKEPVYVPANEAQVGPARRKSA